MWSVWSPIVHSSKQSCVLWSFIIYLIITGLISKHAKGDQRNCCCCICCM